MHHAKPDHEYYLALRASSSNSNATCKAKIQIANLTLRVSSSQSKNPHNWHVVPHPWWRKRSQTKRKPATTTMYMTLKERKRATGAYNAT
ncbi:5459_t:CDS:2 [Entrophospora sp. SA101]|nr:5459_t:CDS:2 [Entrophospora sp. SA101]